MADTEDVKLMKLARVGMLHRLPFYASLVYHLDIKEDSNLQVPTVATDGKSIFIYPGFANSLTEEERVFVLAHEVEHCIMDFFGRRKGRDTSLWNCAQDYAINGGLVKEDVGRMPEWALYHEDFLGLSSEHIYEKLLDDDANKYNKQHFDDHSLMEWAPSAADRSKWEQALVKAKMDAELQGRGAGNTPLHLQRLLDNLLKPKVDWRSKINKRIKQLVRGSSSWKKPNRRYIHRGNYLPGKKQQNKARFACFVDTSGSVTDKDIQCFMSEVVGATNTVEMFDCLIGSFDTEVKGVREYTEKDRVNIKKYCPVGGGGTDIASVFHYLEKINKQFDQIFIFTDGCTVRWGDVDDRTAKKTLFLINSDVVAPFGETLKYD